LPERRGELPGGPPHTLECTDRLMSPRAFYRVRRLPPYVLSQVVELNHTTRRPRAAISELALRNPYQPPPPDILASLHIAIDNPRNHRYSTSRGIPKLRLAITDWYQRRFGVTLDPDLEAITTIGAKEGIGHLMLAILSPGDAVLVPDPTYPIHTYS